jgi:anti-sigma regulatory factor (Ser/Thr protein kinase)
VNPAEHYEAELRFGADLDEIAAVPPWIEQLASKYRIPEAVQFGINVCLEEALANVILHGYKAQKDKPVIVRFLAPQTGYFLFQIDDEAPHFNPLDLPELGALNPSEEMRVGGQGIRLMRQFADRLDYEQLPAGNRLKIGFSAKESK